jgi:tetratricopeptide (TPR) repeat protein
MCFTNQGLHFDAISDCSKLLELELFDKSLYYYFRGKNYAKINNHLSAISDFTSCIQDPGCTGTNRFDSFYERAKSYYELGGYDKAIADFSKVIEGEFALDQFDLGATVVEARAACYRAIGQQYLYNLDLKLASDLKLRGKV